MSALVAEKLAATVGASVRGATAQQLLEDPDMPRWTLDALEANGVLVFPGIGVDDETQVAFSKRLGRVETFRSDPVHPEIFRVTLDPEKNPNAPYLRGTFVWHIDGMTEDVPIMATVLTARQVAAEGGETEFASTYQAYLDLSEDEQREFESVRVVHSFEAAQRAHNPDPTEAEVEMWRKRPGKTHPLIWTHLSGRKSLVLGSTTSHVEGMGTDESREFLDGLLERATRPDRVYRHEWSVGDMVIWDNRGVLHRACPYDPMSGRDMHRTTLFGEEPVQ